MLPLVHHTVFSRIQAAPKPLRFERSRPLLRRIVGDGQAVLEVGKNPNPQLDEMLFVLDCIPSDTVDISIPLLNCKVLIGWTNRFSLAFHPTTGDERDLCNCVIESITGQHGEMLRSSGSTFVHQVGVSWAYWKLPESASARHHLR